MHVGKVRLTNFLVHASTELPLPQSGVVLIGGPNGAGKSSVVEAVSVANWGKTLRGSEPWKNGGDGEVAFFGTVGHNNLNVLRARRNGRTLLSFTDGDEEVKYDTATKAQEALDHLVGDWDVWRRTAVFSSSDAAHFTLATDGERKRLMEALLGYDFDLALDACRRDQKAATRADADARGRHAILVERQGNAVRSLKEAEAALAVSPPPPVSEDIEMLAVARDRLVANKSALATEFSAKNSKAVTLADRRSRASQKINQIEFQLSRTSEGVCYVCKQPINADRRVHLAAELAAAKAEAEIAEAASTAERDKLKSDLDDLAAEQEDVNGALRRVDARIAAAEESVRAVRMRERIAANVAALKTQAGRAVDDLQKAAEEIKAAEGKVLTLGAVEQVLGLKGVRAHLLGKVLVGLEAAANAWLSRVAGPGLRLRLKPHVEKKTGGISDAISLEIEGAGGGFGYKASSQGERRRIDVALLLALADVAAAAHGVRPGTMFFDEVLDSLDDAGIDAVCDVLKDLSKDRCIVVISHSPALVQQIPASVRLHVAGGKVERAA